MGWEFCSWFMYNLIGLIEKWSVLWVVFGVVMFLLFPGFLGNLVFSTRVCIFVFGDDVADIVAIGGRGSMG